MGSSGVDTDTNNSQEDLSDPQHLQNDLMTPSTFESSPATNNSSDSSPEIACVVKIEVEDEVNRTLPTTIKRKRGRPPSLNPKSVKIKMKKLQIKPKSVASKKSKSNNVNKPERKFPCLICHKSFSWNGNLTKHFENVHRPPKEYFKCDLCPNYRTPWKITLDNHVRTKHKGEELRKLPCIFCSRMFLTSTELFDHLRTHTMEQPYFCPHCQKCFSLKPNLQRHLKTHLGSERERVWKCGAGSCFKTFFTQYELKLHFRGVHQKEKRHECQICGKRFTTTSDLKRHQTKHTGEKNFKCDICGNFFTQREGLKAHLLTHSKKRKFKCEICGKSFQRKGGLKAHRFIHEPEKRFPCEICGKRFQQLGGVRIHMQSHVEDPPYKCEICNWAFSLQSNLKRHMKTATHKNRVKKLEEEEKNK